MPKAKTGKKPIGFRAAGKAFDSSRPRTAGKRSGNIQKSHRVAASRQKAASASAKKRVTTNWKSKV